MEDQLQRNDERMQMAQELGGIGTWDVDLETGQRSWSKNLRRIYGVDDDMEASHEAFMALVHPDDRADLRSGDDLRPRQDGEHGEFEHRVVRPNDGEVRWMLSRGDAVTGPSGKATRFLGVAVDITNRHAMEEQLSRSEERLRLAQELGGVGTWDTDLETGTMTWSKNLRRITGVGDDVEETRESLLALVYPDDRAGLEEAMAMALADGDQFEFEYRLVRPNDGELRWMLSRGDVVAGPDGHSTRLLGVAVDITERHLAEEHQSEARAAAATGPQARGRRAPRRWRRS